MTNPHPWFESYESKRAATGFTQNAPGWAYFHRHHYGPGTEPTPLPEMETPVEVIEPDAPETPITVRPHTPDVVGLMGEFASYAWGLATSRLRGWWG